MNYVPREFKVKRKKKKKKKKKKKHFGRVTNCRREE